MACATKRKNTEVLVLPGEYTSHEGQVLTGSTHKCHLKESFGKTKEEWRCMSVTPTTGKLRWQNQEFEVSLSNTVMPCLKKKKNQTQGVKWCSLS